jgi:hypothetical protein
MQQSDATNGYPLARSLSQFGRSASRCVIVWCSASLELHLDAAMQSAASAVGRSSVVDSSFFRCGSVVESKNLARIAVVKLSESCPTVRVWKL